MAGDQPPAPTHHHPPPTLPPPPSQANRLARDRQPFGNFMSLPPLGPTSASDLPHLQRSSYHKEEHSASSSSNTRNWSGSADRPGGGSEGGGEGGGGEGADETSQLCPPFAQPRSREDSPIETSISKSSSKGKVPPQVRKRLTQACDGCRAKKRRCDGLRPSCTNCLRSRNDSGGEGMPCTYLTATKKRGPRRGYRSDLLDRLTEIERILKPAPDSEDGISPDGSGSGTGIPASDDHASANPSSHGQSEQQYHHHHHHHHHHEYQAAEAARQEVDEDEADEADDERRGSGSGSSSSGSGRARWGNNSSVVSLGSLGTEGRQMDMGSGSSSSGSVLARWGNNGSVVSLGSDGRQMNTCGSGSGSDGTPAPQNQAPRGPHPPLFALAVPGAAPDLSVQSLSNAPVDASWIWSEAIAPDSFFALSSSLFDDEMFQALDRPASAPAVSHATAAPLGSDVLHAHLWTLGTTLYSVAMPLLLSPTYRDSPHTAHPPELAHAIFAFAAAHSAHPELLARFETRIAATRSLKGG
ncbi:hypothetical protein BDK51DRAFT_47021 [Blyttiomyces helicus]|uniref:Zn(2)-C6 fungal-type domain-containing protein n=1 Tax=Blyttiomyces helicus TaxID=388810 RepID=A0A4P9WBV2_9FUNG|nr:hypothetical protein BDK51DRAFT_47021 [Blyttiomyces helicus]|eukprot:RKO89762.1 hypothetical protein BDK51DRAFT_47021 [Blyttiomyces helicus]